MIARLAAQSAATLAKQRWNAAPARLMRTRALQRFEIVERPKAFLTHYALRDNPGARRKRHRLGRGLGGGRGKRSGRGNKGWKARGHGKARPWRSYEGGQTPSLTERIPQWGTRPAKRMVRTFSLEKLKTWIETGRIDAKKPITLRELVASRLVSNVRLGFGVKVLGNGGDALGVPVQLEVQQATRSAIRAVERAGGSVRSVYYDRLSMLALLRPERFAVAPTFELPRRRQDLAYYLSKERRGYLSHLAAGDPRTLLARLMAATRPGPAAPPPGPAAPHQGPPNVPQ